MQAGRRIPSTATIGWYHVSRGPAQQPPGLTYETTPRARLQPAPAPASTSAPDPALRAGARGRQRQQPEGSGTQTSGQPLAAPTLILSPPGGGKSTWPPCGLRTKSPPPSPLHQEGSPQAPRTIPNPPPPPPHPLGKKAKSCSARHSLFHFILAVAPLRYKLAIFHTRIAKTTAAAQPPSRPLGCD